MNTKNSNLNLEQARDFANNMTERDREIEELKERSPTISVDLERVQDRLVDTRKLTQTHVENLIESIDALGLIEPIVVDREFRLLAGAHRLAAIRALRDSRPDAFLERFPNGTIPVRIMPIDAIEDREAALGIEVAENAQRRNYSPAEIDRLAKRLAAAGYRDNDGRPKDGEKRLLPALAVIIGRSTRTVRRQLKELRSASSAEKPVSDETRPNGRVSKIVDEGAYAERTLRRLNEIVKHYQSMGADAASIVAPLQAACEALNDLVQRVGEMRSNEAEAAT